MIATRRGETCWLANSSQDATLFIASLLLSRDGSEALLASGEQRQAPFSGQRVQLRSIEARSQIVFVPMVFPFNYADPNDRVIHFAQGLIEPFEVDRFRESRNIDYFEGLM